MNTTLDITSEQLTLTLTVTVTLTLTVNKNKPTDKISISKWPTESAIAEKPEQFINKLGDMNKPLKLCSQMFIVATDHLGTIPALYVQ